MATWPATLPQSPLRTLSEQPQDAVLRSEMAAGPGKTRRRFTAASVYLDVVYQFDSAQAAIFEAWYNTDILKGSIDFTWPRPRTNTSVQARFREPPLLAFVQGSVALWSLSAKIEVLP